MIQTQNKELQDLVIQINKELSRIENQQLFRTGYQLWFDQKVGFEYNVGLSVWRRTTDGGVTWTIF